MKKLMKALIVSADEYSVMDFGALKIAMLALGLIIGISFAKCLYSWLPLIWIIFATTYIYIIIRTLKGLKKSEKKVKVNHQKRKS